MPRFLALVLSILLPLAISAQDSSPADRDHIISIFFGGGSYYISPGEDAKLRQFLDEIPNIEAYEIEIQGHTDDIGNRAYNLRLSAYRARAVQDRLIAYPLAPEAMQVLPLGEDAPEFDNGTWEGKLNNRRVDVILKRVVM